MARRRETVTLLRFASVESVLPPPCLPCSVLEEGEPPTRGLHPIHSRPCRAYTNPFHLTAARLRIWANPNGYGWVATR